MVAAARPGVLWRCAMAWRAATAGAAAAGAGAGLAALAWRYAAGTAQADRSWPVRVEAGLRDLGEVDELVVLPVVERLTAGGGLVGEPGLSYLVRAGDTRL